MPRIRILLVAAIAMLTLAVAGSQASTKATALTGTVGPGFTINLTLNSHSVKNKTLKAGTYRITVRDRSAIHNFHLFGPGVSKKTGVPFKGTVVWIVKFKPGSYTYRCDIHFAIGMIGHFKVK